MINIRRRFDIYLYIQVVVIDNIFVFCNDWFVYFSQRQLFDQEGLSLANPSISTDAERPQPSMFEGTLKAYQLKVKIPSYFRVLIHLKIHCNQSPCNLLVYSVIKNLFKIEAIKVRTFLYIYGYICLYYF